jgi:hypothetical protein
MDHSEEVCRLRELVAGQGATIAAMDKAVPIALTAQKAINTAEHAVSIGNQNRLLAVLNLLISIAAVVIAAYAALAHK